MNEFIGSFALLFCFAAIVIGPFFLPKLPPDDANAPPDKPRRRKGLR
jgi:hypothetical protein